MKIFHLTTHLDIGGISSYVVSLAAKQRAKGVDVICASSGGSLVSKLERRGVQHITLPIRTKNELHPKLIFSLLELKDIVKKESVDLIHAHTRVTQVLAQTIRYFSGVRYVLTCHGLYKRRLFRRIYPSWGDRIIAVSEPVREALVNDFKVPKSKISLMPSGVDIEQFSSRLTVTDKEDLRRYFRLKKEGFVIGSVSRLVETKGIQYLVQAAPFILDEFPKASFLIVGDGPYRKRLEKLVSKLHLGTRFIFTGSLEHVAPPLELMDIFVSPAVSGGGFGIAVLEAMAACKPVIATDVGSIYSLVKEGANGFLVPPQDPRALADKLIELLRNPSLAQSMGEEGRHVAQKRFSLEHVTDQMITLYKDVLKGE